MVRGSAGLEYVTEALRFVMAAWLNVLNTSSRICSPRPPPNWMVRAIAKSIELTKQPRM